MSDINKIEPHLHNGADSDLLNIENIIGRGNDGDLLVVDAANSKGAKWSNVFGDATKFQLVNYALLQISDDANTAVVETAYTAKKTKTLNDGIGTLNIKFTIYGEGIAGTLYAYLAKNGTDISGVTTVNSSNTENISVDTTATANDVFAVYAKISGTVPNARISNFRFYFLKTIKPVGST